MAKKQKLELTWIGKEKRPKLEPRILLEDTEKSHHAESRVSENDIFDNKLIFGDNLLALKSLEQDYTGKVKCIYIDPPYNTGNAFEHYDDGLEHSIWLGLMRDRLELLKRLLAKDGLIFIQLDDYEADYMKVLCDEIFGRQNYRNRFYVSRTIKTNNSQFEKFKSYNNAVEYILCYATGAESVLNKVMKASTDKKHTEGQWKTFYQGDERKTMQYEIIGESLSAGHWIWSKDKAFEAVENYRKYEQYVKENGHIDIKDYWMEDRENERYIKKVSGSQAKDKGIRYWISPKGGILLNNNWTDILTSANDGYFPTAKSEKVIERVLAIATNPGDLVLDSFAGSGTTGAVAHKMGRKWIMVELGEHCDTHIVPRLQKVIDGTDQGGISKAVNWKGGGGFRYYHLAPSLLEKDRWGRLVINDEYNAAMLAEAMCKMMGFGYAPSEDHYWMHGHSTESDFIYITTQTLDQAQLEALAEEVGEKRSLLVCCSAFRAKQDDYPNLTLKKIPHSVLKKCEWGKDDYSLNVQNLPAVIEEEKERDLFGEEV
jgi:adenine-specific DNA-methyltransferase